MIVIRLDFIVPPQLGFDFYGISFLTRKTAKDRKLMLPRLELPFLTVGMYLRLP
jgi:hypothetical protein